MAQHNVVYGDVYGDGGLEDDDIYGDPELASAQFKPDLPPEVAITMDSIYVTYEIAQQPWYSGRIDRAEAEKRIKGGDRAGNFLIRQKGDTGNVFVHSYLSLTRMTIIHNMIEFNPDGSCTVDGQRWVHHKKPRLAEVVDTMQQIRRARKGVKDAAHVDASVVQRITQNWSTLRPRGLSRSGALRTVVDMDVGGFRIVSMPNPRLFLLILQTRTGCYEASIIHSPLGYYMRFSELIAPTLEELVAQMIVNRKAAFAAGLPCAISVDAATSTLDHVDVPSLSHPAPSPLQPSTSHDEPRTPLDSEYGTMSHTGFVLPSTGVDVNTNTTPPTRHGADGASSSSSHAPPLPAPPKRDSIPAEDPDLAPYVPPVAYNENYVPAVELDEDDEDNADPSREYEDVDDGDDENAAEYEYVEDDLEGSSSHGAHTNQHADDNLPLPPPPVVPRHAAAPDGGHHDEYDDMPPPPPRPPKAIGAR